MSGQADPFTYSTIEVPTVVGLLHNILTQYPDNGQIIKELVQNAEDAGATRVEVVHFQDNVQQPLAKNVVQRFIQGPGLCLYNDAVFSEEDWHGIRRLSDSIKKNNPLQVGQFGLGFKSVFHLTDYVTIISGMQVLFMDPSEPENKMCRSIALNKLTEVLPDPSSHPAFSKYFATHVQDNESFPGTLFWFPLRQSASKISDTIYTPAHVNRLFGSFSVEANICLTFLKSLEKITLGKASEGTLRVTHSMKITSHDMKEVRAKRINFRQNLIECKGAPSSALSCSYKATLQTVVEGVDHTQNVRIVHLLPGKNDEEWMTWKGRNKDKHVPLVGVAVPTFPAAPSSKGHIFSFLPLPPDPTNDTALPIQVNGAFVLSQNRRQVKWRTSESSNQEPDVLWNESLVSKVLARAYLELLKELLQETKEGIFTAETWYTFLPSLQTTTGRWHEMAKQVWCSLKDLPIIGTEVCGFLPPHKVLATTGLNSLKAEASCAVRKVLCDENLPLATLPSHILESLRVMGQPPLDVTPKLLRQTLRRTGIKELKENHEHLLCYAAKDKQYCDLCDLPLLPLQNNSWVSFRPKHSVPSVYLCSDREVNVFLGLEGEMASIHVAQPVRKVLQDVTLSGQTQLSPLQLKQDGPYLLLRSVKFVQCMPTFHNQNWFCDVWNLLQQLSLGSVEHIPLLPTSQQPSPAFLTPLSHSIVVQGRGCQLSAPQLGALALLGVVVIPPPSQYIRHIELQGYLYSADRHGTTQALKKVVSMGQETEAVTRFNFQKTDDHREAMISIIDTSSIDVSLRNFLTKLNMFKSQDKFNSKKDSCLECIQMIAPELACFPVSYPETLLTPTHPEERLLALALGAHQMSEEELCIRTLKNCHSDENITSLVKYIIGNYQLVGSMNVLQQLRYTRFVPNVIGSLCYPSELYDPEDEDCFALIGETQQPHSSFSNHYQLLRSLGLRKVQDMPRDHLISIIKDLKNSQLSEDNQNKKSNGLLHAINRRTDCQQVCQAVLAVPFVHGVCTRPCEYPSSLIWATPSGLLVPQGLRSHKHYRVLGSTTPLVECHDIRSVASAFGWMDIPCVESVIQHLKNLAAGYQVAERRKYFSLLKQIYHHLSAGINADNAPQLTNLKTECCIFTEHGFKLPQEVYILPGSEDLQLQPYLHALPFDLREDEQLFLHLGCARQQSPSLLLAILARVQARHQDGSDSISSDEVKHDRQIIMSVLGNLKHHLEELSAPLLVPVMTHDETLELAQVECTAYTEGMDIWLDSKELGVKVVHDCVDTNLARTLGVAPLQSFLSAGGETVMEWGQREPLTTRLRNLLQHYRDGVSILKELVQNADDAGATTVHLLYDERQNEDAQTLLLGPGMEQWQGPALWAYNNASFSEQDFENLREVGAGTKEFQPTKIGKFGLGFSSVYNLTDVPSFISGSSYVVFDPHMTHLSHSNNSAGLRFNFKDPRNSYMLRTLSGQFQPFVGVFGCELQQRGSFEGTLFRLPLRTIPSKISNTCYFHSDMVQLLKMFSNVMGQLLLFTQNISSIHVFHLSASASFPSEMVELFHAARSRCQPVVIPGLPTKSNNGSQSVMQRAAALFTKEQHKFKWMGESLAERSTTEIRVQCLQAAADLCGVEKGDWNTTWVTSWHTGCGSASKLAEDLGGKALPVAAVAVPVQKGPWGWHPLCLTNLPMGFYHDGHFHCFIPLPVKTMLPLQINGVFEVTSDRTNLLTKTDDDRHSISWNTTLAADAIVRAYLGLAEALRHLGLSHEVPYHAIWPMVEPGTADVVAALTEKFYHALQQEDLKLFRCSSGEWHSLDKCCFLDHNFHQVPQIGDIAFEFLQAYLNSYSEFTLVQLPKYVLAYLGEEVLSQHVVTEEEFFSQYFIPKFSEGLVSPDKRDQLTLHLIDAGHSCLKRLHQISCIPTQPHGTPRPPSYLVKIGEKIAKMFSVNDERFPIKEFLDTNKRCTTLVKLGVNTDRLPRELLIERAESVTELNCSQCACDRVQHLLNYISKLMDSEQDELVRELWSVPFLPVMPQPEDWNIAWHGECHSEKMQTCAQHNSSVSLLFDSPTALCLSEFKPLVGSCHLLLHESLKRTSERVLQKLGVITCPFDLPIRLVLEQLYVISTAPPHKDNQHMCHSIYGHLENIISHRRSKGVNSDEFESLDLFENLKGKKILLTKNGFKEPKLFAVYSDIDCAPDLFSAHTEGLEKYRYLMDSLGIKNNFDYEVVFKIIQDKKETTSSMLTDQDLSQISKLLDIMYKVKTNEEQLSQDLHLPDAECHLQPISKLSFDDGANLSSGKFPCLHRSITVSPDMLKWLGIVSKTRKRLQESSNRLCFGQNEPLTTRLRNILEDYPCDYGILKELLQNADDAGATEFAFIKDFRHLPCGKLFDPKWEPIQGPALIVYNNRGFTEKDLENVQDLGNSCKKEDPATTGQYGIGFNAVYHLTDAPSFLTKGPKVPNGETLCLFDPHCWYDPAATPQYPGVQFVNLNELRKDHPDSFIGYLESELPEEGTVFRLPLRTATDSLIVPRKTVAEDDVIAMLNEFKDKMPQCLLFLRNIRRISIREVQQGGTCRDEYCVEACVASECKLPALFRKYGGKQGMRDPCSVDMVRISYQMNIRDSQESNSHWLIVQQQGVEDKNSLPTLVQDAFANQTLNLLPHGGIAVLLEANPHSGMEKLSDICSTSCYLPLPISSGLPFSINGHFALNPSRRDVWVGNGDPKGLWNEWLMKELLVPLAVHAVDQFKAFVFPCEDSYIEQTYQRKMRLFHNVLPLATCASSKQWKNFIKWFYEEVRNKEFPLFDSFIPETDLQPSQCHVSQSMKEPARSNRRGQLRWSAFHPSEHYFTVYFLANTTSDKEDYHLKTADILKRLGMKISSEGMYLRLSMADPEFPCPLLCPETALTFLKSWDLDNLDSCMPAVGNTVTHTPFLKASNVLSVLKYITKAKDFSGTALKKLPLLLTNDHMLRCYSVESPVFLSHYYSILPTFKWEFVSSVLVTTLKTLENSSSFQGIFKNFTPTDFVERFSQEKEASYYLSADRIPVKQPPVEQHFLKRVWRFVVDFIENVYQSGSEEMGQAGSQTDWAEGKKYILKYLGDWAFYPVREGENQKFLIPLKNAWQVLHTGGQTVRGSGQPGRKSVFSKLPILFPSCLHHKDNSDLSDIPYIPHQLKLETSLEDPLAVLELLYFHKESVKKFFKELTSESQLEQSQEILEYLGSHVKESLLSKEKICSLQIFSDLSGHLCDLVGRRLVVLETSIAFMSDLILLCEDKNILLANKSTSRSITKLYTYIEPSCILEVEDLYAEIILPNVGSLTEKSREFYLNELRMLLPETEEKHQWKGKQQKIVSALKESPFIEVEGVMKTANNFYDPSNELFLVMELCNLPESWRKVKWHHMLRLAGMISQVTPDNFIKFLSLSAMDKNVRQKSEVLCRYLDNHLKDFKSVLSEIVKKDFLLPAKSDKLEGLMAHYKTESGLVSLSEGVFPELTNVIWSTRSILPEYAIQVTRKLSKQFSSEVQMCSPPVKDILKHIIKLCSFLQKEPGKFPDIVGEVMESIYGYLSDNKDNSFDIFKQGDIPLIHIPNHTVFAPIKLVVESLEEEILPYLYKAPTIYGKFFSTLKKLGMKEQASSDTYAQVLSMIYAESDQDILPNHMKLAMKGLVKNRYDLKNLSVSELYLPTLDKTLRNSVEIFVTDNNELFVSVKEALQENIFVGFEALEIQFEESSFVELLPERLRPKLLSEVCQESLMHEGMEEVSSFFHNEIQELLQAEEFKTGVLRVIDHYKMKNSNALTKKERREIVALLETVVVRQVNKITIALTMNNEIIGQRKKKYFYQIDSEGNQLTFCIYLVENIEEKFLACCLHKAYSLLLKKWKIDNIGEFNMLFNCVGKPHYIHTFLNNLDVKAYSAQPPSYCRYICDVGSYLEETFIAFLDNGFYNLSKGEIVCLRKYSSHDETENSTEDEDNIYMIVQVVRLVTRDASCQMLNTYEVQTSIHHPCLLTVKAYNLFRFVRRKRKDLVSSQTSSTEGENLSEEAQPSATEHLSEEGENLSEEAQPSATEHLSEKELFKKIQNRVIEIWQVQDERERRHLLRRLLFEWHPDKNPGCVDLCTRIMQYIQSLLGKLERGEHISDEEDQSQAPHAQPSQAYSRFFRQPRRPHRNHSSRPWREQPRSDLPEARRWYSQACHDLKVAEGMARQLSSWVVFISYQAAEKVLLATLYSQDMDEACKQNNNGPLSRTLTSLALLLNNRDALHLTNSIQETVGHFLGPLYPTIACCPHDRYTLDDTQKVLQKTRKLFNLLKQHFV